MKRNIFAFVALLVIGSFATAQDKPIKALLVTAGGYHDYKSQQTILSEGIAKDGDVKVDVIGVNPEKPKDPSHIKTALSKPGWAKGYDVVVYNFCDAGQKDNAYIKSVVDMHGNTGTGAIMVHCAMHSYHWNAGEGGRQNFKNKDWVKLVGVGSPNHGPKDPIKVTTEEAAKDHPVMKGVPAEWTTPEGELYNVGYVADTATVLAMGVNKQKKPQAVVWANKYGKAKVVGISLGHHNSTMKTENYMTMIKNSVKWAAGK